MRKKSFKSTAVLMAMVLGATSINAIPVKAEVTDSMTEEQLANLDTDKDGLEDYLEEYFATDKTLEDTDNDGLSDYMEIMKFKTEPLKMDTDGNGISDGEEDADRDGISNILEVSIGTNPFKADTDEDGLKDALEVNVYKTSPILCDSDGDGLLDGEEVELELSPLKRFTRNIEKDCKKLFSQVLKNKNIEESLCASDNLAIPSLWGNLPGLMERRIRIESSTVVLGDLEGNMVGKPIEIVSDYEDGFDMKLSFSCLKSTLKQVKGFQIAHYKDGEITYLNTTVLLKNVSAKITEGGTYFVLSTNGKTGSSATVLTAKAVKKAAKKAVKSVSSSAVLAKVLAVSSTDTDYDGVSDSADPKPNDNAFTGTVQNDGFSINSRVDYAMDYRAFFKTPSTFSSQLCKVSSVYANLAYGFNIADQASGRTFNLSSLMSYQGMSDVKCYNLKSGYSDYDLVQFYIGHRTVTYSGTTKDIVAVSIRGTGGGIAEWSSNFDIGTTAKFSSYSDWTDSANHKGFDVAATRLQKYINNYVSSYCSGSNTKAYWVVGHSRGAAVANILAAKLVDAGKTTYSYTFATPNTTTKSASAAGRYTSIFNIVNKDDFVPCLPCTAWGFRRYGKTSTESIADKYENEWEDLTGIYDYNPDTYGMNDTIAELGKVLSTRNKAYTYTCKCHGDGSKNDITITNYGTSEKSREEAIAKIPANALPYCKITRHKGTAFWGWDFDCCQTPSYFMQILAALMSNEISKYRFVVELDIADHYEDAKTALIGSAIGGLEHPHYTESYFILAKHAAASNFS
ncbi:lipase family protein [[Clostridium] polysaccharolyticum]|uniref:Lipase (Class 3) n=1 Tax=[Clostridium] polysaccharolyticum TaxID=29364 RepID=A0A1I0EJT1_9FIRM|nr:hypothetical protein [[Clostridium] polysaccharolyticum]SET45427.1 Lipase (class 3) [[Clostridium] polysaccharolyticum]